MSPRNTSVRRGSAREGVRERAFYDESFKLMVVCSALARPSNKRIKPTCACYPKIEPCQVGPSPSPSARAPKDAHPQPGHHSGVCACEDRIQPHLPLPPPPMQLRRWIRKLEPLARERMAAYETSMQAALSKRAAPAAGWSAPATKRVCPLDGRTTAPPPPAAPAGKPNMLSPMYDLGLSLAARCPLDIPDLMYASSRSSSVCTSPSQSPRQNYACDPRLMPHASVPVIVLAARTQAASAVALPAAQPLALAPLADNVHLLVPMMVVKPYAVLGNAVYAQGGASYAACWQPQQPHTAAAAGRSMGAGHDKERTLSVDVMDIDSLLEDGLGDELRDELFANEVEADAPGWLEDCLSELMGRN